MRFVRLRGRSPAGPALKETRPTIPRAPRRVAAAATRLEITDAVFARNLCTYARQCVFHALPLGLFVDDLRESTDVWRLVTAAASPSAGASPACIFEFATRGAVPGMELRAGDRIRRTRNNSGLGPVNSQSAKVAAVRDGGVLFRLEDGRMPVAANGGHDRPSPLWERVPQRPSIRSFSG